MTINKTILDFATDAHSGQLRKYTGDAYITHPIAVAQLVIDNGGDQNMVNAAILHDVLEDTTVTHSQLRAFLHLTLSHSDAEDTLSLVVALTDVYTHQDFPNLNRKARKLLEAQRLGIVSQRAKAIKRLDIVDNTKSIVDNDPKFSKVYLAEKEVLLTFLNQ
jgi:(p)ppGpp synthase/HD superfamily hydrolase